MKFNIGDRVRVRKYEDIPSEVRHKGMSKQSGNDGEIVDCLWSNASECYVYKIHFDGYDRPSHTEFVEEAIDLVSELDKPTYSYEFEFLENLVIARLYEIVGEQKYEVARGHGHIFHDGINGIAQASSYALKKIYEELNGGRV
jgi:hypothetical protein